MVDAIPAGTRSVYPSGLACPGEALDRGQRRASVHRAIEERCRGLCYRWGREPRGEDRFKRDAAMARAARGRIECSGSDRPTARPSWQHYTTPHHMRGEEASNFKCPLRVVTTRPLPIFRSQKQWPLGQARRASAIDPRQCQEECQCPLPSLIHQHRQCRGKMRAQIESEPKHTYWGYRVVRRREVYSHLSKRQSAHHRVIQQVATGPEESSL